MSKSRGAMKSHETQTDYVPPEVILKQEVNYFDMFDIETRVRELVTEITEPLTEGLIKDR